jgi:glycosyltransferase involved in cell wall biosynthesis
MLRPKIVMITTVHGPFDPRIFHKEAVSLAQRGFEITVIAPHSREEVIRGVKILPIPPAANRLIRIFRGVAALFQALREKADLYHFHDPELMWVGLLLKLFTSAAVVYDAHEYYAESILTKGWIPQRMRPLVGRVANFLEKRTVRFLDGVVTATDGMEERFKSRTIRTVSLNNYPIEDCFCYPRTDPPGGIKTIIYVGNINKPRGLEIMIQTVGLMKGIREDFRCLLVGKLDLTGVDPELREQFLALEKEGFLKNLGQLDYSQIFELLHQSQIGWNPLLPVPHYTLAVPTKFYEYLAAGLPVIAGDFGPTADLVRRFGCGYLVDPFDPKQHAEGIIRLISDQKLARGMASRGYKLAISGLNWPTEERKLILFYKAVLEKGK